MKKEFWISLLFFLSLSGCGLISIKGSFKGLTSNFNNSKKDCAQLMCYYNDTLNVECKLRIVNGLQLKQSVSKTEKAVVYIWSSSCKSQYCPSPAYLKSKSDTLNITLFIVSEFYDCNIYQTIEPDMNYYGIDTKYYKTNFTSSYLKKFLFDLTGVKKLELNERLLYFENGRFIKKTNDIELINADTN